MATPLRIGVLGLSHDHVWGNLEELQACDGARLVAVADPHPPLLQRAAAQYGCPTYDRFERLLDAAPVDAVFVFTDNAGAVELVQQAAQRSLPMMVEKPMAHNLAGADRMLRAARRPGVRLMINWPFAWWPQMQRALELSEEGELGRLWQVRYRAAHAGPEELGCSRYFCDWLFDPQRNGGGALIDYCCYGALLSRVLLGRPDSVSGVSGRLCKEQLAVEDNAVLLMSYAQALSVSEASWTQIGNLASYVTVICGTRATLLVEPRQGGRLLLATEQHPEGAVVELPPQAPAMQTASTHFISCLRSGEDFQPLCQDQAARDVQEILEAGQRSAQCHAAVRLPLEGTT